MIFPEELLLASGSPRRRQLLASLGWPFRVEVPSVDEAFLSGERPEEGCLRLSCAKAEAVGAHFPDSWIIAADTVVLLDGEILGKPESREESRSMILRLAGRTHEVLTGVTLLSPCGKRQEVETTEVTFRPLTPLDAARYAATGEGDDKAGAYGIQGLGSLLVSSLRGDYFNVVGLPLCRLGRMFESLGCPLSEQWRHQA